MGDDIGRDGFEQRAVRCLVLEGGAEFRAAQRRQDLLRDAAGEEDTALIPFEWIADAKLVLTDELLKRGAALRAARGEPEDDGLPGGAAEEDLQNHPTPTQGKALSPINN